MYYIRVHTCTFIHFTCGYCNFYTCTCTHTVHVHNVCTYKLVKNYCTCTVHVAVILKKNSDIYCYDNHAGHTCIIVYCLIVCKSQNLYPLL